MQFAGDNIQFRYTDSDSVVLDQLSFTLQGPGLHAIFGPSGVGKTSLARIISSEITHYQGEIHYKGIQKILYSSNMERLPGWTGIGSILKQVTPVGQEALLEELLTVFNVDNLLDSRFPQLSLGQQNRINLLRYLVQDFDLLILDESLANVDEKLRQTILLHIKKCFPDRMFLSISHNLTEVARFCKEILVLGEQKEPGKSRILQGLDCCQDTPPDRDRLDQSMLEIMNAC